MLRLLFAIICVLPQLAMAQDKEENAIRDILQLQATAWNNGDLRSFMDTYWKSDSLRFVGKNGITYGWQNTLDNYKKSYPSKETMGKLHFRLLVIQRISQEYYNVIGEWKLVRSIGNLQGHFSLLIKNIKGKWLIVQDHTS